MPNPMHIEQLRLGVESWNAFVAAERPRSLLFRPDFSGINLRKSLLDNNETETKDWIDLSHIDLKGAIFTGACLERIKFNKADLSDCEFSHAVMAYVEFKGAQFVNTNLSYIVGRYLHFEKANFLYATVDQSKFEQCFFEQADLSFARLSRSEFRESQIWKSRLFKYPNPSFQFKKRSGDTESITSVVDLTNLRSRLRGNDPSTWFENGAVFYFRGENSTSFDLRPSVMRDFATEVALELADRESEMLAQLVTAHPASFRGLISTFEELVLAQHFRLPTRLLDVTRNPLVGLFFASQPARESDISHDGRLHVFAVPRRIRRPFNSDAVSVAANFAKLTYTEQRLLLTSNPRRGDIFPDRQGFPTDGNFDLDYRETITRLRHFIAREKPYFEDRFDIRDFFKVFVVEPQRSFPRIQAQSGAFLISAFHERFEADEILKFNADIPIYAHFKFTVPCGAKSTLLDQLEQLNITEETLYPELETSAKTIKARFQ